MTSPIYQIAGWRFDPSEPVLRGLDEERWLEDRAARVLDLLCRRRGHVVSKEDLITEVWRGRAVSSNSVSIVIGSLRRALDEDPRVPVHLVTVGRRGYRLVEEELRSGCTPSEAAAPIRRRTRVAVGTAAVAAALLAGVLSRSGDRSTTIVVDAPLNATDAPALTPVAKSLLPVVVDGVGRLRDVRVLDAGSTESPRVRIRTSLIIWNGAPELSIIATDIRTNSVIWTGFAAGPPAQLAKHVTARLRGLQARLPGGG